jgi:hypothetical protein
MPPTGHSLAGLGFSTRDTKFLERVVQGGRAGGTGSRYEDWYATCRLLEVALVQLTNGSDSAVEMQAEAFVNDVVVHGGVTEFCQAKTSPRAAWDTKLRRQFSLQRRLCRARSQTHRLLLVTPHKGRLKTLRRRKPSGARVIHHPLVPPWDPKSPAAPVLRDLSAERNAGPSQTEALAKAYSSALLSVAAGQRCLASAATAAVRTLSSPLVRSSASPPATWAAAEPILRAIPGLTVALDRGLCTYSHGPERGVVGVCDSPSFARFLDRVIERRPATFMAFSRELP